MASPGPASGPAAPTPPAEGGETLYAALAALFGRGVDAPLGDDAFEAWALRVFRWQFEANAAYRGFAEGRGRTPDTVADWRDVPAVPATAFKHLDLRSGGPGPVDDVFLTSGTTADGLRGRHPVPSRALYRASSLPNLRAHLLPELEDGARIPVLALLPPPDEAPGSSLTAMVADAVEAFGDGNGGWFAHPEAGLDLDGFAAALDDACARGAPVLVAGTAFAFVHWLDGPGGARPVRLPDGSRVMETGGFKGRSREVSRAELYRELGEGLGVPLRRIVNEYGMTELLSQFWEPVLRDPTTPEEPGRRGHRGPPWVRTRVLDPATLEELPRGSEGLLCHLDLANAGSVACVLTEDVGVAGEEGFRVRGRVRGAEPRGCSRAMDELLGRAGS